MTARLAAQLVAQLVMIQEEVVLNTSSWFGKLSDEPPLTHESWNGKWELSKRREDWTSSARASPTLRLGSHPQDK